RATIEVKEKRIVPPKDDNQPCNLLAKCDGFVVGFEIESGNIVVPKNTAVRKGDILVSGIVEYADKSSALKKAAGKVFAETEHEIMIEKLFLQKSIIKTGQIETRSVFDIFGISIPLFLGDIDWQYEKEIKEFKYKNENMYLPVFFTTATYNKITEAETRYNTEETIALARRDLEKKEAEMLGDSDILRREEQINVTEEGILLKTRYFCKENIAKPEILLITTIN
ncbi:MAG: sporulation protein YqfD, partial [Oscillospiraceae bacterium]